MKTKNKKFEITASTDLDFASKGNKLFDIETNQGKIQKIDKLIKPNTPWDEENYGEMKQEFYDDGIHHYYFKTLKINEKMEIGNIIIKRII